MARRLSAQPAFVNKFSSFAICASAALFIGCANICRCNEQAQFGIRLHPRGMKRRIIFHHDVLSTGNRSIHLIAIVPALIERNALLLPYVVGNAFAPINNACRTKIEKLSRFWIDEFALNCGFAQRLRCISGTARTDCESWKNYQRCNHLHIEPHIEITPKPPTSPPPAHPSPPGSSARSTSSTARMPHQYRVPVACGPAH